MEAIVFFSKVFAVGSVVCIFVFLILRVCFIKFDRLEKAFYTGGEISVVLFFIFLVVYIMAVNLQ